MNEHPAEHDPRRLSLAIIAQAIEDLDPRRGAETRRLAWAFFTEHDDDLQEVCDYARLPMGKVKTRARALWEGGAAHVEVDWDNIARLEDAVGVGGGDDE